MLIKIKLFPMVLGQTISQPLFSNFQIKKDHKVLKSALVPVIKLLFVYDGDKVYSVEGKMSCSNKPLFA
jgi:hypothetical protein